LETTASVAAKLKLKDFLNDVENKVTLCLKVVP
jgi:hypothetical protein